MHTFLHDFRYALRTLRRSSGLSLVIVASLAIGIGANTAIFSVVNALLLEPLPYPDPDRLAVLWLRSPGINIPQDWPSPGQYIDIQTGNSSFEAMSISQGRSGTLVGLDQPERVEALRTSSSLFHLLGARPLYGRLLLPEDDAPGKPAVVILSHGFWKRLFNSDPNVVGRAIALNGLVPGTGTDKNLFTVAGVLRPDFLLNAEIMPTVASIRQMDVFLPLPLGADAVTRRGDENYNLMARLKPGVTMEQAQADVGVIAGRIREKDQRDKTFTISVVPLRDQVVGDVRRPMLVLLGAVALVLLIACANVANLLLTRASGRQKEVAIRTALGAGWQRLVRQLLTETVLLGLMGGAVGLLIARLSLYVVRTVNPGNIPRLDVIEIDGAVLAFTFGMSVLTGIVFGLAPAVRAARVDLNTALKTGGRSAHGDGGFNTSRRRLRSLLVVVEVALSLMLLIGAGLLVRSFVRLQGVSPGFTADSVISMRLGASGRQFPNRDAAVEYFRQVGDRIAAEPGVKVRGAIVRAIHEVDPTIPVYDIRTMQDRMSDSLARQRFSTLMLGAFALFALLLAVVGVYGVMSYLVSQGTRDIGVRMALGAQRGRIVRMVVRQGMELTGAGIVLGLIGAAALTRVMASLLFGISATDVATFSAVPIVLAAVALLASYLPARRATRVDPVVALREE